MKKYEKSSGKSMADLKKFQENLVKMGYKVTFCKDKETVKTYFSTAVEGTTVGIGGSITVQQLGLSPVLKEKNQVIFPMEMGNHLDDIQAATRCSVYITSVNGASETGELINIDGRGNRVSASIFGTERVIFIIGRNKVAEDYEKALWRARNIASPLNAQRLNRKTPCAKNADKCYDCQSPERICRSLVVHLVPPGGNVSEVVLVDEDLGY